MHSSTGEILFYDGAWHFTSARLPLKAWSHIAMSWDGTSVRTYLNGALSSTLTGGRSLVGDQYFGARSGGTEGSDGIIDEVLLYDRPLHDAEIAVLAIRP